LSNVEKRNSNLDTKEIHIIADLEALKGVVEGVLPDILKAKIVTLEGDLGAGKTTLVKEVCRQLGIDDLVSSPTFSLINEYVHPTDDIKVFHMDLYRIEDEEELHNIGFEEYLYAGHLVFIEWPQIASSVLPERTLGIHIDIFDNSSRRLTLTK